MVDGGRDLTAIDNLKITQLLQPAESVFGMCSTTSDFVTF